MTRGYLVLDSGRIFPGRLFGGFNHGNLHKFAGEVVVNTSMTGYQEIITDPSYHGQIGVFSYPAIGNCGINNADSESLNIHMTGIVIGELCEHPSHYLSTSTLASKLKEAQVPGLCDVDTRALVKLIRHQKTVIGTITDDLNSIDNNFWQNVSTRCNKWVQQVSTKVIYTYENKGPHVVLLDFGCKKSTLTPLLNKQLKVTVVPYNFSLNQLIALNPAGVVIGGGPGDPALLAAELDNIRNISKHYPTLGVGLGHQLLALAHGCKRYKLAYGHRGANHPVKDTYTGKVFITQQSHGFAIDAASIDGSGFKVSYCNINDQSVEGLSHAKYPINTIQFHQGLEDTSTLDEFYMRLFETGDPKYAIT